MKNRWFHAPHLHSPGHGEERKVGWLELFYDLIYVATIIQLGNALSENVGWLGFAGFAALFAPIWFTWTGFTFFSNRFVVDDFLHRLMVFLQMFGIGAMAVFVPAVFEGDTVGFSLAYASVRFVLVAFYLRAYLQVETGREMTGRYAAGFALGAAIWGISAFVPTPYSFALWALAMAVDFATPLSRQARALIAKYPPDVLHMSERYGLLTIIVLGEAFVKVLSAVADKGPYPSLVITGGLTILITTSLWWIYFDDVAGSRIKPRRSAAFVWIYTHLPLTIAITASGVAIKKAMFFDPFVPAPPKYRWLVCGTLALAFLAVAAIDWVTQRRVSEVNDRTRLVVRLVSAAVLVLFAPAGAVLPAWAFLALVAAVGITQVIVDLALAPLAPDPEMLHEGAQEVFESPQVVDIRASRKSSRPEWYLDRAVRKGTPGELRRDLYFHFMEGSWMQLLGALVLTYLASNVIFATLYLLEPGSVTNANSSFLDAFFFSVQTMATIGYGVMSPGTTYANVLMTLEAAVGLLGVAVTTGIVFTKLSRPRSSVLFSQPLIVTTHEGQPTLMFRVGNTRGNEVVEATVRVVAMFDEVTAEGQKMRRIRDLELVRNTSPTFSLTWTVMHVIDETSPLHDMSPQEIEQGLAAIVVTMIGYDSTYAQNTHARYVYYPDELVFGRRFKDVISALPDGRLVIDYASFHDLEPQDESAAEAHVEERREDAE